jgi:hypothetical protein
MPENLYGAKCYAMAQSAQSFYKQSGLVKMNPQIEVKREYSIEFQ